PDGVMATRYSLSLTSRGMPTFTAAAYARPRTPAADSRVCGGGAWPVRHLRPRCLGRTKVAEPRLLRPRCGEDAHRRDRVVEPTSEDGLDRVSERRPVDR